MNTARARNATTAIPAIKAQPKAASPMLSRLRFRPDEPLDRESDADSGGDRRKQAQIQRKSCGEERDAPGGERAPHDRAVEKQRHHQGDQSERAREFERPRLR